MILYLNKDYESSELFILSQNSIVEFAKFVEADNMITFCAAVENIYNAEMFLLERNNKCFLCSTDKMRNDLRRDLFLFNVGLKNEISISFGIFEQAMETLKKLEYLIDIQKDETQRKMQKVKVARKLGTCLNLSDLESSTTMFYLGLLRPQVHKVATEDMLRREKIKAMGLTADTIEMKDFLLTTFQAPKAMKAPAFTMVFEDVQAQHRSDDDPMLESFFLHSKNKMEEIAKRVFPERSGIFERVNIRRAETKKSRDFSYILSLRFEREDYGPGMVFCASRKRIYVTEGGSGTSNTFCALLTSREFYARRCIIKNFDFFKDYNVVFDGRPLANSSYKETKIQSVFGQHGFVQRAGASLMVFSGIQRLTLCNNNQIQFFKRKELEAREAEIARRAEAARIAEINLLLRRQARLAPQEPESIACLTAKLASKLTIIS